MKIYKTQPYILRRILAGLIDYLLIYLSTLIIIFSFGEQNSDGEYVINFLTAIVPFLNWIIFTIGIETSLGYTLGNATTGLKPIPVNGEVRKLSFWESFKRHLLDPVDMFPFGLIGVIIISSTKKNQRLGDLFANTVVVKQNP